MLTSENSIETLREAIRGRLKREPTISDDQIRMIAFKYLDPLLDQLVMSVEDLPNSYDILKDLFHLFTIQFSLESYNLEIGMGEEAAPDEFLKTKILEILRKHIPQQTRVVELTSEVLVQGPSVDEVFKDVYLVMYKLIHEYLFNKNPNRPDIDDINMLHAQSGLPFIHKEKRLSEKLVVKNVAGAHCAELHLDEIFSSVFFCTKLKWGKIQITFDSKSDDKVILANCLLRAVSNGFTDLVEFLIVTRKVNPNCFIEDKTPLTIACIKGNKSTIVALLENGADPNIEVVTGSTTGIALHIVVKNNALAIAAILLERGADQRITTGLGGCTALHLAGNEGSTEIVKLLLSQANAKDVINFPTKEGATPLSLSLVKCHFKVAQLLVDAGADLKSNASDFLFIACGENKTSLVEFLVSQACVREIINANVSTGLTFLGVAAGLSNPQIVSLLIANGANPSKVDTKGNTPLYYANEKGRPEIVELLNSEIQKQERLKKTASIIELNSLAIAQFKAGNFRFAIDTFKLVLDFWRSSPKTKTLNQKLSSVLYNLGSAEMGLGCLTDALNHLTEAVQLAVGTDKDKYHKRLKECELTIASGQPVSSPKAAV